MSRQTPDVGIPPRLAGRMSMAEQYEYLNTRLSRRRTLVTAGAVAGGLLTGCTSASGSAVVPFGRHLAFGADPRTQMRISWQVPVSVRRPYVRIGARPDDLGTRVEAEVRALRTPDVPGLRPALEQYYVHVALDEVKHRARRVGE